MGGWVGLGIHPQHILSPYRGCTAMLSLAYEHHSPPHRQLNAALAPQTLIERCGAAPPCSVHAVPSSWIRLSTAHRVNWIKIRPFFYFTMLITTCISNVQHAACAM